jgi:alkylation response protein AidB-like acyl-CoA dehydrogenase
MDFELTAEQRTLREEIVRFAREELNDDVIRRDAESSFSIDAWKKCAALGIQGLPVPTEYGGARSRRAHDHAGDGGRRLREPRQRVHLLARRADVVVRDPDRPVRHRGAEATLTCRASATGR